MSAALLAVVRDGGAVSELSRPLVATALPMMDPAEPNTAAFVELYCSLLDARPGDTPHKSEESPAVMKSTRYESAIAFARALPAVISHHGCVALCVRLCVRRCVCVRVLRESAGLYSYFNCVHLRRFGVLRDALSIGIQHVFLIVRIYVAHEVGKSPAVGRSTAPLTCAFVSDCLQRNSGSRVRCQLAGCFEQRDVGHR